MNHYCSFSEAMREGAKLHPQTFYAGHNGNATCAYGAGVEAIVGNLDNFAACPLFTWYPYLNNQAVCPACVPQEGAAIIGLIYHLNDDHRWTRERIADWLEKEEEKLGFIHVVETEALKPEMIAEFETVKATVPSSCSTK